MVINNEIFSTKINLILRFQEQIKIITSIKRYILVMPTTCIMWGIKLIRPYKPKNFFSDATKLNKNLPVQHLRTKLYCGSCQMLSPFPVSASCWVYIVVKLQNINNNILIRTIHITGHCNKVGNTRVVRQAPASRFFPNGGPGRVEWNGGKDRSQESVTANTFNICEADV